MELELKSESKGVHVVQRGIGPFVQTLRDHSVDVNRGDVEILQINIGKLCNQACNHCHVEAGPKKIKENMSKETLDRLLELLKKNTTVKKIDITGGAPELNAHFKYFVERVRELDIDIIDRCNLTVLFEPGQQETAVFLAKNNVEVVASLPCYSKENVEKQRGWGVFGKSIEALKMLNSLGYGKKDSGLTLNLVYNPSGAFLPPSQEKLERDYKRELKELFAIEFNQLFTIANMPIKRFLWDLERKGQYTEYMQLLLDNFNPSAADSIMCKSLISIGWQGDIFDCDFNQMLEMPIGGKVRTIWDIDSISSLSNLNIYFNNHCYGCTAGSGSSCGGALTE